MNMLGICLFILVSDNCVSGNVICVPMVEMFQLKVPPNSTKNTTELAQRDCALPRA